MCNKMKKGCTLGIVILTLGLMSYCQAIEIEVECDSADPSSEVGIVPYVVEGNPALCYPGIKIDPPNAGTYNLDIYGNTVTVTIGSTDCGQVFSWSVSDNIVIDQVVAKGSNSANIYDYTGEDPRPTSDGNLHSPVNPSGFYADLSHIDFCYHYKLTVSKTATAEFTRTYDWDISKSCDGPDPLTLSEGQTYDYPFSWTASVTGHTDSDWKVTGTITIVNETPFDTIITSITDVVSGPINAVVDCSIPQDLPSGQTLECTYSAELPAAADGTNTVTVETDTPLLVEGGSATADYAFGEPTEQVDECIDVTDDCGEIPVTVCEDEAPKTHSYTCPVGPYDVCGQYTHTNTASFVSNDGGDSGEAECVITVDVPCEVGCTLTPGYWKTHSEYGPAPYDDTWALLGGPDTIFFLSGQSYFEVLWTPPQGGNAYYILAHQYIAAYLNFLNDADPTDAQDEFDSATALFQSYTPAYVATLKGQAKKEWVDLAAVLDYYNNGLIGPGHCDEESDAQWDVLPDPQDSGVIILRLKTTLDYNRDGMVNIKDMLLLIEAWGSKDSHVDIRLKSSKDGRINPEEGIDVQVIGGLE